MSMENNDKYIAKTWIDNGADEEYKKSFLESLLNQWQGEGNGFNADKLDGKHYCEIVNDFDQKIENLIPAFQIGRVRFDKENIEKQENGILRIGFDGVKLNIPDIDGYDDYKKLPWDTVNRTQIPDLLQTFQELYNIVTQKVDITTFDEYKTILDSLDEFKESLSGNITGEGGEVSINADSVNGVRFFVKTYNQYDALVEESATNDEVDSMLKDPHNFFILVDNDTEIDDDILAQQPGTQAPAYYEFKNIVRRTEKDDGTFEDEKWLVYKHQDATVWQDMCLVSDLVDYDYDKIMQMFSKILTENSNYEINQTAFVGALKKVQVNDDSDYPLVNFLKLFGIKELKSEKYGDKILFPSEDIGGNSGRSINMDSMIDGIIEMVDEKVNEKILNVIYPLGSLYISCNDENPNNLSFFSGTEWQKIEGRFLLGSGSLTEGDTTYSYPLGEEKGEVKHKLEETEMPKHIHSHDHFHKPYANSTYFLRSTGNISVNQKLRALPSTSGGEVHFVYAKTKEEIKQDDRTGAVLASTYSDQNTKPTGGDSSGNTVSHNNMPPYLAVNIWRRIR